MTELASNNELELVNKYTRTWTNGNHGTLIDQSLITPHKIFDINVIEQLFGSDHILGFCQNFYLSVSQIFSQKNHKIWFSTKLIPILESTLSNRKHCVQNGFVYSNCVTLNHGVPQRKIFEPLIFKFLSTLSQKK